MFLAWIAAMWTGCAFPEPDCASGFERNPAGDCEMVDADLDTGGELDLPGAYSGSIVIDLVADAEGLEVVDLCRGDVGLDQVDGNLVGVMTCRFEGTIDAILGGEVFEGTIAGDVVQGSDATGSFFLDLGTFGALEENWSGTILPDSVSASFEGSTVFDIESLGLVVPVSYHGGFEAQP